MGQYEIVPTTAEDILAVVDAILVKPRECTQSYICEFSEISEGQVNNALKMAMQFSLVALDSLTQFYSADSFLTRLMVSSGSASQRATVLRLVFEQYEPYATFKSRFQFTESAETAAKQIKLLYGMSTSYRDIKNTIINIATYSRSIVDEGANTYRLNPDTTSCISAIDAYLNKVTDNTHQLTTYLGAEAFDFIDKVTVFNPLVDAFGKTREDDSDACSIIQGAGNAFESFLVQYATAKGVSLIGKNGIIQKAEALPLSKKHKGMAAYVGQVRNASDHGADVDENGSVWAISTETATIYPIIITNLIKAIIARDSGQIVV